MDDQVGRKCDDSSHPGVVSQPGVPDNRFECDLVESRKKYLQPVFFSSTLTACLLSERLDLLRRRYRKATHLDDLRTNPRLPRRLFHA